MKNIISVDLEDWYTSAYLRDDVKSEPQPRIEQTTRRILDLFDKKKVKATFFCLGSVAKKHPELIKEISQKGHEIASHGYSHKPLWDLNEESFEEELRTTNSLLQAITGKKVEGFRAPYFSIDQKRGWAINVLKKCGFTYDSSVFPMRTPLYGEPRAPQRPYFIDDQVIKQAREEEIKEFPLTIVRIGPLTFPVSGGFYARAYPFWFQKFLMKKCNEQGRPVNFYFHPWEIDNKIPKIKTSLKNKFISYYNTKSYLKKIEKMLNSFEFTNFKELRQ